MKKSTVLILSFIFIQTSLCQINFQTLSSFEKINESDNLVTFKLFDYDQDGDDDMFCAYQNAYDSRIVVYSPEGEVLVNFSHANGEYILAKAEIFSVSDQTYVAEAFWKESAYGENPSVKVQLYKLSDLSLSDEFIKFGSPSALSGDSEVHSLEYTDNHLFFGFYFYFNMPQYADEDGCYIMKLGVEDGQLTEIQSIVDKGSYIYPLSNGSLFACGIDFNYHFETRESRGRFTNVNTQNLTENEVLYEMNGDYNYVTDETVNYPISTDLLSCNDTSAANFGPTFNLYYKKDQFHYANRIVTLSQDFADTLWMSEFSPKPFAATVITGSDNNSYLMLFGTALVVLNRMTGDTLFSQAGNEVPNKILRNSQGELRFLFDSGNEFYVKKMSDDFSTDISHSLLENNRFEVRVYPNPSHSAVHFSFGNEKPTFTQLTIYDFLGRVIENIELRNQNSYNFFPKSKTGVYFYKISSDTFTKSGKFVIE